MCFLYLESIEENLILNIGGEMAMYNQCVNLCLSVLAGHALIVHMLLCLFVDCVERFNLY